MYQNTPKDCQLVLAARMRVEKPDLRSALGKICILRAPKQEGKNCPRGQSW